MVKLEHVNLVVSDIDQTVDFIQTAFPDWIIRGRGESEWYGNKRHWLHIGNDDYYITLNDKAEGPNRNLKSRAAGLAHIGFAVDDLAGITARLQNKGYPIATIGADHPYRKTIYFIDPAGFAFQFILHVRNYLAKKHIWR